MTELTPTQLPALVENTLLLRREDFEDLLDRATVRAGSLILAPAEGGLETSRRA